MSEIKVIIFFFFLIKIFCLENENTITILDNIKNGWDIVPLNIDNDYLMMIIGSNNRKDVLYFNKFYSLYKRSVYSSNGNYNYSEVINLDNINLIMTTSSSIELFNGEKFQTNTTNFNNLKRSLIKIGSYYYHIYADQEGNLRGNKIYLENNILKMQYNNIIFKNNQIQSTISCIYTNDANKYFLCGTITNFYEQNKITLFYIEQELKNPGFIQFDKGDLHFEPNYFLKLLDFKLYEDYKYIIISCFNETGLLFKYFKYYSNEASFQVQFRDYYFYNIQTNGMFSFNDAIPLSSNKIIKIYAKEKIIITIFQFYNNYNTITAKNYIFNKFDIYYSKLMNPRLEKFIESLVVCLSVNKNDNSNEWNPAYFFIGYEKYNYSEFNTNDNIKISDLTSIENNIYSRIHIKIISIPEDFIFTNYLNDEKSQIKPGIYLDIKDELIFKQYKKNINVSVVFSNFVIDDDYSSIQIVPNGSQIPQESKYIEGKRKTFDILIKECNNGFHEIELYEDICIKDKPEGYYLDEKNNIYRKCFPLCSDCEFGSNNETDMKCIKCIDGYILKESTSNCIYKDTKEKIVSINRKESSFYVWFIVILCIAFIFSFITSFINRIKLCCKISNKKDDAQENIKNEDKEKMVQLEEKKDN